MCCSLNLRVLIADSAFAAYALSALFLRCARATARRPVSASAVRGCRSIGVSSSSFLPTLSPVVVLGSYVTHVGANVILKSQDYPGMGP